MSAMGHERTSRRVRVDVRFAPRKQTFVSRSAMSALCHKQTFERRREGPRADVGFVISMR